MRKEHEAIRDEQRYNSDGTLDEIVIDHPTFFHLEQMQTRAWWIGVSKGEKTLHLWVECDKKGHLSVTVTDDEIECATVVTDLAHPEPS